MPYVPGCEHDLFISYAHIDNEPLATGVEGWVTFFHRALRDRLRQLLGADDIDIWRDPKLQGNDFFSDTLLVETLPQTAALVSILSPRYIKSDWCLQELKKFCQIAEETGGLRLEDKGRIFKVIKTQIPRIDHPEEVQGFLGYEFFDSNPQTGRAKEFRPELGKEAEQKFLDKLEDLACEICDLLKLLKERRTSAKASTPAANGAAVYLAETTSDLSDARDKIRRELRERGCAILPDADLPVTNIAELHRRVRQALAKSKLAVHLIGQNYGLVPEGETRSLIEIQHEMASELAPQLTRLIWLPPGLQTVDDRHQRFVTSLREGKYAQQGADLLETALDELKTSILYKLRNGKSPEAPPVAPAGPPRIYLIYDQADEVAAQPLADYLFDQRFEVEVPAFKGDETARREGHQDKLRLCDAALIFCGEADDAWLSSKKADIQKVYGWGRQKPLQAQAVYLAAPGADFKQRFRSHELMVVKNFAAFASADLNTFVAALRKEGHD